tara:strand:- start:428 stop:760 length:333 start_codon:yes stop_codon:yes gene_type:complete
MITHRAFYTRHHDGNRVLIDIVAVDGTTTVEGGRCKHPVEHLFARNGYDLTEAQAESDSLGDQLHRLGAAAAARTAPHLPAAYGFEYDGKPTITPELSQEPPATPIPPPM